MLLFPEVAGVFENIEELPQDVSYIFSLGGDGTLLKSFLVAQKSSIPLVGINSGRLGFLSDISRDEIEQALLFLLTCPTYITGEIIHLDGVRHLV